MYFTIWPKKKMCHYLKVKKITCGDDIAFMSLLWSSTLLFYLWQSDIGEFYISLVLHFIPIRTNILQTRTILGKSRNQLMKLKCSVLSTIQDSRHSCMKNTCICTQTMWCLSMQKKQYVQYLHSMLNKYKKAW